MAHRGNETAMLLKSRDTDSPVLPVEEMERLHKFRPDIVDWILEQTKIEAESRRQLQRESLLKYLLERKIGQILGFLIGLFGILGGSFVAVKGYSTAGGIIATSSICTLAVAFLGSTKKDREE